MTVSTSSLSLNSVYELKKNLSLPELFQDVARDNPYKEAVVFRQKSYTYNELNSKSNQLAYYLVNHKGLRKGSVVGFYSDSSEWTIVIILAILKAGCIYLPIDSKYPLERIQYMVEDAEMQFLLIESFYCDSLHVFKCPHVVIEDLNALIAPLPTNNLNIQTSPQDIAYIMYTSGTTGKPNGVLVPQSGIIRLVYSDYIQFSDELTFLKMAPVGFDASTFEIFGALLHGARLVIYGSHLPEFDKIGNCIREYGISCLWLTAALFNAIVDEAPGIFRGVKYILTGGEALSVEHIKKAQTYLPEVSFVNGYGPTECTTFTCCYPIPKITDNPKSIPIGKPIAGTRTHILNSDLLPVKPGDIGELYVSGEGVALGYLNNPELTRERFVDLYFGTDDSVKAYKTGDLCRELHDGNIDFEGRVDFQVKINGFRIEIDEIEVCLRNYLYIADAKVLIRQFADTKRIVAFVIPRLNTELKTVTGVEVVSLLDKNALLKYLQAWLPAYMIPHEFIELSRFPINVNGKIDRVKLLSIETVEQKQIEKERFDGVDGEIKELCEKILKIRISNRLDNFFELGAESLGIVQLLYHISQEHQCQVPVNQFYLDPCLGNLLMIMNKDYNEEHSRILTAITNSRSFFDEYVSETIVDCVNPYSFVKLKDGTKPPLFVAPGMLGNAFNFVDFAAALPTENPVYVFEYPSKSGQSLIANTMEELAAYFIRNMKKIQPHGPYHLMGFSFGGRLVFEIVKQLELNSEPLTDVMIIDTEGYYKRNNWNYSKLGIELYILQKLPLRYIPKYIVKRLIPALHRKISSFFKFGSNVVVNQEDDFYRLWFNHQPNYVIGADVLFVKGLKEGDGFLDFIKIISADMFFAACISGSLRIESINCGHVEFFQQPYLIELIDLVQQILI